MAGHCCSTRSPRMDIALQAKLLRAIQEREIDRLGGNAPVKINVRILATSNRDLPTEVAAGVFAKTYISVSMSSAYGSRRFVSDPVTSRRSPITTRVATPT